MFAELGEDLGLAVGRIELRRARHQAEATLAWTKRRLSMLSENASDAVTLHRLSDGHMLYVSPSVRRVLGIDPETLLLLLGRAS